MVGTELALFILVGSIAIFSAVMMLISKNAIHSAIFLILNFSSVAFMYLMLNAPFLAMVQITVYTGAIMVLFLFVIMLLGAEKLLPSSGQTFHWLVPTAIALTVGLLLIASIAILDSEIEAVEPEPSDPILRVIHANSQAGTVDVYLDGERIARELAFTDGSDFVERPVDDAARHTLEIYDHDSDELLISETVFLYGNDAVSFVVMPEPVNGSPILRVDGSLEPVEDRNTSRLTVVNAMVCDDSCPLDVVDYTDNNQEPIVLAEQLLYGNIAPSETLRKEAYSSQRYTLEVYPAGEVQAAIGAEDDIELDPLQRLRDVEISHNDSLLWIITSDARAEIQRSRSLFFENDNRPEFGSPRGLGQLLFTTYMLPFELIAILLLVAMVGTIVLTTTDIQRPTGLRRNPRRMAAVPGNPTVEEYMRKGTNNDG